MAGECPGETSTSSTTHPAAVRLISPLLLAAAAGGRQKRRRRRCKAGLHFACVWLWCCGVSIAIPRLVEGHTEDTDRMQMANKTASSMIALEGWPVLLRRRIEPYTYKTTSPTNRYTVAKGEF